MSKSANAERDQRRIRQVRRLVFASQSMTLAIDGCEFAVSKAPPEYVRTVLAAGTATLYSSPFTEGNELGKLEDDFSRFENQVFAAVHREMMAFRHQLYAHRDLAFTAQRVTDGLIAPVHFIDIEIMPQGTATVAGSQIHWPDEAFSRLKALCEFQRERIRKNRPS